MKLLRLLIAALIGTALIAGNAATAQSPDVKITMRTFEVVSLFRAPPWSTGPDVMAQSELSRQQGKSAKGTDVFIWELIPKGEDFSGWSELYAIMAETPLGGTAQDYRNGVFNLYSNNCDGAKMQPLVEHSEQQIFALFCPAYRSDSKTGEIAVMNYHMHRKTLVKHYYHKRGAAFTLDDQDSWPMTEDEFAAMIERIGALETKPAK